MLTALEHATESVEVVDEPYLGQNTVTLAKYGTRGLEHHGHADGPFDRSLVHQFLVVGGNGHMSSSPCW